MKKLILVLAALMTTACTDASIASFQSLNDPHRVTCHSGGRVIFDSCSTGTVESPASSDGYYFKEKTTNLLVEVSGECVISMRAPCPANPIGVARTAGKFPAQEREPFVCKKED